jgi:hypothetical protein
MWCWAPLLHVALDCQAYQMRREAALSWFRRGAACESRLSATGPPRRGARLLPPCLVAQPPPSRCLQALSGRCLRRIPHVDEPPFSQQQGDVCAKLHASSVCFKCFICFRCMLQVFHTDVAKVDRDVAHVAMDVRVCCKLLFSMFHLFFYVCCKYVYLDVAYIFTHIM